MSPFELQKMLCGDGACDLGPIPCVVLWRSGSPLSSRSSEAPLGKGDRQTGHPACAAPFICHASAGEWHGYPHRAGITGAPECGDDPDLYSRDAEAGAGREIAVGRVRGDGRHPEPGMPYQWQAGERERGGSADER